MTWKEDLRRVTVNGRQMIGASFRGVPFLVEASERAGGRRAVVHEFPLRDDPYVEDLGRKARSFRVDGYVVGDDYITQRDALLSALEDVTGPGELIHPYHGTRSAVCVSVSVSEKRTDGGIAAFVVEFAEAPAQGFVAVDVPDGVEQVGDAAAAAHEASATSLVEQYETESLPSFAFASAETALVRATEGLAARLSPIVTAAEELAEFSAEINILAARASSLVRDPAEALDGFLGALETLGETMATAPFEVIGALLDTYSIDLSTPVIASTPTRAIELANQNALIAALKLAMLIEAARLAPTATFATIDDAFSTREEITDLLDEQAATADELAYGAIVDLRSHVLRAVPGGRTFARVMTVNRNEPLPSLLLAYQLYGSVDLESDIIDRNGIQHPGFISGAVRVLSDG